MQNLAYMKIWVFIFIFYYILSASLHENLSIYFYFWLFLINSLWNFNLFIKTSITNPRLHENLSIYFYFLSFLINSLWNFNLFIKTSITKPFSIYWENHFQFSVIKTISNLFLNLYVNPLLSFWYILSPPSSLFLKSPSFYCVSSYF